MPGSALRGASLPSAASTRLGLPCLQPPLYGPIDELPCPLVGCLGSRFDLLDDVGLIPLEIPNTAAFVSPMDFEEPLQLSCRPLEDLLDRCVGHELVMVAPRGAEDVGRDGRRGRQG
jgi:hypothetical protein